MRMLQSPGIDTDKICHDDAIEIHIDGAVFLADRVLTTSFVGVYAGRLSHSHYGGEVPFVFYANRIPIILASGGA